MNIDNRFFLRVFLFSMLIIPLQICAGTLGRTISSVEDKYGVKVHYKYQQESYFPSSWILPPINAIGEQVTEKEAERMLRQVKIFLSRIPKTIISDNLSDIYLLKDMKFYGLPYGQTNSRSALYIKSSGIKNGYTNKFLLKGLFHEFSSILMRNYTFPSAQWKATNNGHIYSGTGREILHLDNLSTLDEKLSRDGFITKYATSSLENDFNVMSEWLFVEYSTLKELAREHRIIRKKKKLAVDFYQKVFDQYSIF